MKNIVLGLSALFIFSISYSQESFFTRLEAMGQLPVPFHHLNEKGNDKVITNANQNVRLLLNEGRILFGDTLTTYMEGILDRLLVDEPELRKQIHMYTLKTPVVNAYIYPNGFLFVSVGLIAQASNEAEIAFVLSHELGHFIKKHGFEKNTGGIDIESYLRNHVRYREMEIEADQVGFERFYKKAGYANQAVEGVYDMLQFSFLPFDEMTIDRSYFEKSFYQLEDAYFLNAVTPVTLREDYVDTFSTHPNIKNRKIEMEKRIKHYPLSEVFFIEREASFLFVKKMARYETINQQLISGNYLDAFYNCIVLKTEENKNDLFLNMAQVSALYGLYKAKMSNEYAEHIPIKENTEGALQFAAHFFEKINKKELVVLCLRKVWEVQKTKPENEYLSLLFDDLVAEMINHHQLGSLSLFSDYSVEGNELEAALDDQLNGGDTKYGASMNDKQNPVVDSDSSCEQHTTFKRKLSRYEPSMNDKQNPVVDTDSSCEQHTTIKRKLSRYEPSMNDKRNPPVVDTDSSCEQHTTIKRKLSRYEPSMNDKQNPVVDSDSSCEQHTTFKRKLSRYEKIKGNRLIEPQSDFKTVNYMLVDFKKDAHFVNAFETSVLREERAAAENLIKRNKKIKKNELKEQPTFLVFQPLAYTYKNRIKGQINSSKTIKQTKQLEKRIKRMAHLNNIQTEIRSRVKNETELDYQTLSRVSDFYRSLKPFSTITYESRDATELAAKIGTPYINLVTYEQYVSGDHDQLGYKSIYSGFSIALFPFLPMGIYQWVVREYNGILSFSVYDLKKSNYVYAKRTSFSHEQNPDQILQALYQEYYNAHINIIR